MNLGMKHILQNRLFIALLGRKLRSVLRAIIIVILLIPTGKVSAQEPPLVDEPPGTTSQNVFVSDSFKAEESLKDIQQLVEARQWPLVLDQLEQLLKLHGRQVIAREPGLYVSIRLYINELIASWPAEGLAAYRSRYESIAEQAAADALATRNPTQLMNVIEEYYCTSAATQTANMLAQLWLERGEFELAAEIYQQLLSTHPDRQASRTEWSARLVMSLALAGKRSAVDTILQQHGPELKDYPMEWLGKKQTVETLLPEWLEQAEQWQRNVIKPRTAGQWPTWGGDLTRQRLEQLSSMPSAPLWTFQNFAPSTITGAEGVLQSSSFRSARQKGKFLALYPASDGQRLYFQDHSRLWALAADSGTLEWNLSPMPESGSEQVWSDQSIPMLLGTTVTGHELFAVIGHQPLTYYGYQTSRGQSALLCVEATTGEHRWQVSPEEFGEDSREVYFEGPPLVSGTGVYTMVRRRKAFGFEDAYLWCFDRQGALRWKTHLGSSSIGGFGFRRPTQAIISQFGQRIIVASQLGTIASIDAVTGLVEWLRIYETNSTGDETSVWSQSILNNLCSWDYNPPILIPSQLSPTDESIPAQLAIIPLDSDNLLLLNLETGSIQQSINKSILANVRTLLGWQNGRLYGAGDTVWAWSLTSGQMLWSQPLDSEHLMGRPLLTSSAIIVSTDLGLFSYSLEGERKLIVPWSSIEEAGNVIPVGEHLLIAGNDHLTMYGIRRKVFDRMQAEMDAQPDDPWPALRFAEVIYRTAATQPPGEQKTADLAQGWTMVQTTVQRAMAPSGNTTDEFRSRLFRDLLDFSDSYLHLDPPDRAMATQLLILAGNWAPDPAGAVQQKARLAQLYQDDQQPVTAVRVYQQVLSDRSLHDQPWPTGGTEPLTARRACREAIQQLIEQQGREVYRTLDEQADGILLAGLQSHDSPRLDQVIEQYPNSLAAPKALLNRAQWLRDTQPIQAAQYYYRALLQYPAEIDQPQAMLWLAECYVLADRRDLAYQWLSRGTQLFPQAQVTTQGNQQSLRNCLDDLIRGGVPSRRRLPAMQPPLARAWTILREEGDQLLTADFINHAQADWSRILILRKQQLTCYRAADGQSAWSVQLPAGETPRLLANLQGAIILANRYQVQALQPNDGSLLWSYGEWPALANAPNTDWEQFPYWLTHVLQDDVLVSLRSDGEAVAWDISRGVSLWQRQLADLPQQAVSLDDYHLIYRSVENQLQRLVVINAANGEVLHRIALTFSEPIVEIRPTPVGLVLLLCGQKCLALNPWNGTIEWQKTLGKDFVHQSLSVGLDGIVLTLDGLHLSKLSLHDGEEMWRSAPIGRRPALVHVLDGPDELYALDNRRILSLDPYNGRLLGVLQMPENCFLDWAALAADWLVVMIRQPDQDQLNHWAFFEHRPVQLDRQLDLQQHGQQVGPMPHPMQVWLYDHLLLTQEAEGWVGWKDQATKGTSPN
ncbi:MAG: Outer membrane protein assembly factor BamB [Phycisphaerae bacterium]|nr:Outer membrane protein assembly factor BamB [Phycisphaerae bacterium]